MDNSSGHWEAEFKKTPHFPLDILQYSTIATDAKSNDNEYKTVLLVGRSNSPYGLAKFQSCVINIHGFKDGD